MQDACLTGRQAAENNTLEADDNEGEEGIEDSDFGDLDKVFHCFQCRKYLPASEFPPGVDPNDLANCKDCQDWIDHTPVQQYAGGCGTHTRAPRTGGLALCENCRGIHWHGILP